MESFRLTGITIGLDLGIVIVLTVMFAGIYKYFTQIKANKRIENIRMIEKPAMELMKNCHSLVVSLFDTDFTSAPSVEKFNKELTRCHPLILNDIHLLQYEIVASGNLAQLQNCNGYFVKYKLFMNEGNPENAILAIWALIGNQLKEFQDVKCVEFYLQASGAKMDTLEELDKILEAEYKKLLEEVKAKKLLEEEEKAKKSIN